MNNNNVNRSIRTLWKVVVVLLTLGILVTYYTMYGNNRRQVIVSETGCCSIEIYQATDYKYLFTWVDNTMIDSYYAEAITITNPVEIEWTIAELKDLCWTQHGKQLP